MTAPRKLLGMLAAALVLPLHAQPTEPFTADKVCPDCRVTVATQDARDVASLLRYLEGVRKLPEAARLEEFRRVEQLVEEQPKGEEALRLALLMMLPNTPFHDLRRAGRLLDGYSTRTRPGEYRILAGLLLGLLEDSERLERQLADERRERRTLQEQLDALKQIEETIQEREQPEALPLDDVGEAEGSAGR